MTGAEQGNLASGSISNRTRNERFNNLSLTGNWRNRQLDSNGDGDFTDELDLEEPSASNVFTLANEWTDRKVDKPNPDPAYDDADTWGYDYDPNGNMTREGLTRTREEATLTQVRKFKYDPFGRLTAVHSDDSQTQLIAEYRYNGLGQRIMWRYGGVAGF